MNVLVLDDEKLVGTLITDYLKDDVRISGVHYSNYHERILDLINELKISILFLDLFMPDLVGLDIITKVKEHNKNIKIIILSSHFDAKFINKAVDNGCDAYLNKNCSTEELILSVDFALEGKLFLSSDCKHSKYFKYEVNYEDPKKIGDSLSERELDVLKLISDGHNSSEIADKLFISKNTVDFHKKSLLRKFGTNKATKMVKIASKNNII